MDPSLTVLQSVTTLKKKKRETENACMMISPHGEIRFTEKEKMMFTGTIGKKKKKTVKR